MNARRVYRMAFLLTAIMATAVRSSIGQGVDIKIRGMKLDSPEMQDSLALPYWRALASSPCPQVSWKPSYASVPAFQESRAPLVARLRRQSGSLQEPLGSLISRRVVFNGARYSVERVAIGSRVPGSTSTGFVVRPRGLNQPSAPLILLHGSGVVPAEAFGWLFADQYSAVDHFQNATFARSALEFAEAGYTVFIPWFGDDNDNTESWPQVQWRSLGRTASMLGAKSHGLGGYFILLNEVASAIDFLAASRDVDMSKLAVMGWAEGAQIASAAAALDPRITAVVRLAAPLDRRALRRSVDGVFGEAAFTHLDCALGDFEMAALVAPRPLLYAYSTQDQSVARFEGFISPAVMNRIRTMYTSLGFPGSIAMQADTTWSADHARAVRLWLDQAVQFHSRPVPGKISQPTPASSERYRTQFMDSTEAGRRDYVAQLGPCAAPVVRPDYSSLDGFTNSVAPLRNRLSALLRTPVVTSAAHFRVTHRERVALRAKYNLDYVEVTSDRSSVPVIGLLATPITTSAAMPAVISMDADYDMSSVFGLLGRERTEYLNAYGDFLASNGTVVFAPWMPSEFPEVAAGVLGAMNPDGPTSFTFTLTMYASAVDFLASLPSVDPTKITAWGISYAGFNALYLTALDQRVSTLLYSNPVTTSDILFRSADAGGLADWFGEMCSMIDQTMLYLIAPRRLVRENGLHDDNGYESSPLESIQRLRSVYSMLGIPSQFEFFRHTGGHETLPRLLY